MAHIQEANSRLWRPESTHELADSQKMFIDNIEQLEALFTELKNGVFKAGDASKLGGHSADYFAIAENLGCKIVTSEQLATPISECASYKDLFDQISENAVFIGYTWYPPSWFPVQIESNWHVMVHKNHNGAIYIRLTSSTISDHDFSAGLAYGTTWTGWRNNSDAVTLGGHGASEFMRIYQHYGVDGGGTNGSELDMDDIVQAGVHKFIGNFTAMKNIPTGFYGDASVMVIGDTVGVTQLVQAGASLCFRKNDWDGSFGDWNYTTSAPVVEATVE